MDNKKLCCYSQRSATRKDLPETKKFESNSNTKQLNYWTNPIVREVLDRKLLPNSVKLRNDDRIVQNENMLTYRCNKPTCHMNNITTTPAGVGNNLK